MFAARSTANRVHVPHIAMASDTAHGRNALGAANRFQWQWDFAPPTAQPVG